MTYRTATAILACALAIAGCDDGNGAPSGATRYTLRVENVAGAAFPTALSPGVWTAHGEPDPFFTEGMPDRGEGLEALAEDGDPSTLAGALDPERSGTFDTPATAMASGPVAPGDFFETEVFVTGDAPKLSFATMVVESNDVFLAPMGAGIDLSGITGETDITDQVHFWNAGTEDDEAPGLGPHQAPRQAAPNSGSREGRIRHFESGTRTLPLAFDIAEVAVTESDGTYTLTFQNVSRERGLFVTPFSPIFWAVHSEDYRLYRSGEPAPSDAFEQLVEIGDARALSRNTVGTPGVLASGIVSERTEDGGPGFANPGEAYAVEVTPSAEHPFLSVASMVANTNDAFLGFADRGLRLLDEEGNPRSAEAVQRDARRMLAIWDAGTEQNEMPGAGLHQGAVGGVDNGADDPDGTVRRYDDATNDVAGPGAGGIADITITQVSGRTFEVHVVNTSERARFRGLFVPFVWVVHDENPALFDVDAPQSPGLIILGEDCLTNPLFMEMQTADGVLEAGVAGTDMAPIFPGDEFRFEVSADPAHRYFNLITMPYPSNDMLLALEPPGVALLDEGGVPRSDAAIAADVAERLYAWDTGTEANEGGGGGLHNVPLQNDEGMQDWGPAEGDGTVRAQPDPAFSYPAVDEMVRVTITPVGG